MLFVLSYYNRNARCVQTPQVREFIRGTGTTLEGQPWRLFDHGSKTYKSYSAAINAGFRPDVD